LSRIWRIAAGAAMICGVEDPDFPVRPDDDELLLEELTDMLELRPELVEAGLSVTVDAMLRSGTPVVELWLHQPDEARCALVLHRVRRVSSRACWRARPLTSRTPRRPSSAALHATDVVSSRRETSCSASAARATEGSRSRRLRMIGVSDLA